MVGEVKDLTRGEYELFRKLVYAKCGISLGDKKMQLLRARLGKRLRQGGFCSYREYYNHVVSDSSGEELCMMLDAITTNTTHLFRESHHFDLLKEIVAQWATDRNRSRSGRTLRIWSAGCSSGEEPYSIAMVAHDILRDHPALELKILATDLSIQMLSRAKLGLFELHRVGTVPPVLRHRYLLKAQRDGKAILQVAPELRRLVTYSRFNLMASTFPFRHGFHVIFCRNVMIYFDRQTQQDLVNRFASQLRKGGYLMIGHSESLHGVDHSLSYVKPTVYRKS